MQNGESRLGYLMKRLEISGKELSENLSIDITSISKWRTNQRRLSYKNKCTREIAHYLLVSEMEGKRKVIDEILRMYMPSLDFNHEGQVADALAVWLTDEEADTRIVKEKKNLPDMGGYNTSVRVYTGDKGIEESIQSFWQATFSARPGKEILIIDFGDIDYSADNIKDESIRLIHEAIRYGHRIKIIDGAVDTYRPYISIFRWMSVYLSEAVEVWYRQARDNRENHYSINLLPGVCSLYSMSVDSPIRQIHCMMFTDKESVDFFAKTARTSFEKSQKMIETVPVGNISKMLEVLDTHLASKQLTYMLNPSPTFRSMSQELLRKILRENDVGEEYIRLCLEANRKTREIRERCKYRQLYDLGTMEAKAKEPYTIEPDLSKICKKEIRISRENLKLHMETLSQIPNSEMYSMTLTNLKAVPVLPTHISMIVQDDRLVVAWDSEKYNCRMYSMAIHVIGGFYEYMEEMWESIPAICKTDEWRKKQFSKMLQLLA